MNYSSLLTELGISPEIVAAHEGKYPVPKFTLAAPPKGRYGFPPIIIPIWSNADWPGYIGVVTSWFGGCENGFVKHYSGSQITYEIALSFEQLGVWLAFDFLCNVPNSSEVGDFAQSLGLFAQDKIEDYFRDCQDYSDLAKLPVFGTKLPKVLSAGPQNGVPDWVLPRTSKAKVLGAIAQGNYHLAWQGINSPGLDRHEIVELLDIISPFASDIRFEHLVECWKAYA